MNPPQRKFSEENRRWTGHAIKKTNNKAHPLGPRLEPTRKEKSGTTKEALGGAMSRKTNEDSRDNMARSQDGSIEPSALESCCRGPTHRRPKA